MMFKVIHGRSFMYHYIISIMIGYLFGCILTAEIVSYALSGKSIRTMGSRNPGMSNAMRIYGYKWGFITLAGDLCKTFAAVFLAFFFFQETSRLPILYAGLGCIIGHNFPFWNGFHGGKGVACTCAVIFSFAPLYGLISCIIGLMISLLTKYLAVGAVVIPVAFFLFSCYFSSDMQVHVIALLIILFMMIMHFPSIKKILRHQEKKELWTGKNKKSE